MAVSAGAPRTEMEPVLARRNRLFFLVALLPAVLIAAIISRYGVNVPYGDEWSVLTFLGKWDSHQLTFADFYATHNGHRILLPRLVFLALAELAPGNLKAEMFFSLLLCSLTSVGLYFLLRRSVSGSTAKHLALWALINLLLFSPIQAENWLWGFQLQVFLSNLCVVGAIVCVTSSASLAARFAGALVFAMAGTFSFGNGVLIWPAVFVVLLSRRERFAVQAAWIVAALLIMLAYVSGYPAREPTPAATRWFDYLLYFTGFLGAPLARIPNGAPLIIPVVLGGILVTGFVWIAARLVWRREGLGTTAPWLALGSYAMGSAAMAAFARIHSGPVHALDSRYTTVGIILVISLIGLVAAVIGQDPNPTGARFRRKRIVIVVAVASVLVLYAINLPFEFRYLRLNRSFRERGKAALEFSAVLDVEQICRAVLLIREDPETLARCLRVLDRLKMLHPPRRQTAVVMDTEDRPKRATDEYGFFENLRPSNDGDILIASGWSYLPVEGRPPAAVVLAYLNGTDWKAFALSDLTEVRPDLSEKYHSGSYLDSGWRFGFSRSLLPPGDQEISAWAVEAEKGRIYRLPGFFFR
ncbi:MAG: hypothetical protein DMF06_03220 [Verrucomicrobia bacterium]|nr:MAG: hypothetical protein DMF06_03220 [Verrucomicrobiota bacterium]